MENRYSQKVASEYSQPTIRLTERPPNGIVPESLQDAHLRKKRKWARKNEQEPTSPQGESRAAFSPEPQPAVPVTDILDLRHQFWDLDPALLKGFHQLGIWNIYEWQCEALRLDNVLGGGNIVYTAPTSAGKSLVADILMIKRVLDWFPERKAIIVLPYIAIVSEKVKFLKNLLRYLPDIAIGEFHSGSSSKVRFEDAHIAVCTIERANLFINNAIEDASWDKLCCVVIDEFHLLGEERRGATLESFVTKLRCIEHDIQIIGMSATLSNSERLAGWLEAAHYVSQFRPVDLEEYLVYENQVHTETTGVDEAPSNSQMMRALNRVKHKDIRTDFTSSVVALAQECVVAGNSCLVFCASRNSCEQTARLLQDIMPKAEPEILERRQGLMAKLSELEAGLDPQLAIVIPSGVAFHHAGLTTEERDILAEAYDEGILKVICCTATIAAGVNLPARRVIIHARVGRGFVSPATLCQMRGRAGRKGKDVVGESFLCCDKKDLQMVREILSKGMPAVTSAFTRESDLMSFQRAILDVIATKLAASSASIENFVKKTFLYYDACELKESDYKVQELIERAIQSLVEFGLVERESGYDYDFIATPIGIATAFAGLDPKEGIFLHKELSRALVSFSMDCDMQAVYTLTPISATGADINWDVFLDQIETLSESELRVATFLGVQPAFVVRMAQGYNWNETRPENIEKARIYRRFYAALILRDLLNDRPLQEVANKFATPRGFVQSIATTCRGFASTSQMFCVRMGWRPMGKLLEAYAEELYTKSTQKVPQGPVTEYYGSQAIAV